MDQYPPLCDGCRALYADRNPPQEPPCNTCRETPLEENVDAIRIFFVVRYQLIMGFNGPVDVSHGAIHEAMDLYRIRNPRQCFEKLRVLSRWWIGELIKRGKNESI